MPADIFTGLFLNQMLQFNISKTDYSVIKTGNGRLACDWGIIKKQRIVNKNILFILIEVSHKIAGNHLSKYMIV